MVESDTDGAEAENQMILTLFFTVIFTLEGTNAMPVEKMLPDQVDGWRKTGRDQRYDRETIFEYMDGAAELYLSYGLDGLTVRGLSKPKEPGVTIELFTMRSSEDAYGVFSLQREGADVGIGMDSEYGRGLLRFWKGNYFVNIYAERETEASKRCVLSAGKTIANAITQEGTRPELLSHLPSENLLPTEVRYLHNHVCLNYCYFIANENILDLSAETDVVLATYAEEGMKGRLLLIGYASENLADVAATRFERAYMPDALEPGILQTGNGKWTGMRKHGRFLILFFDAPTRRSLQTHLGTLNASLKE